MSTPQEEVLWEGSSSHALNFWLHVACWLFCWLVVPIFISLWKILENRSRVYQLTSERLRITQGIFSKRTDQLELYRVKDQTFLQPFMLRMFGKGNLVLNTTDATTPTVTLEGIPATMELRDRLRAAVEACRDRKRARLTEISEAEGGEAPHA